MRRCWRFLLKHVDIGDCDTSVNDCGTRGEVSTIVYMMRSLMTRTEKNEPTITYSGMIPGEEPPYRPLLTEQIDIEQGLQELGQVSAGLVLSLIHI